MSAFEGHVPDSGQRAAILYRRYAKWLTARMRRDGFGDVAEDVVQETFVRVVANDEVELRHPQAFLLKIARNLVGDHARRGAAQKRTPPENIFADGRVTGSTEQFETVLLKQVILSLPKAQREVFLLSRFGGLSHEEIGRTCGISVKTVVQMRRVAGGAFRITEVWYEPLRKRALAA